MISSADVEEFRAEARSLMVDACTITRGTGTRTLVDGEYVTAPGAEVYSGACRVKPRDNADQVVEAGGTNVSLWPYVVSVPIDATKYLADDTVTVTASANDPALAGRSLRVRQVAEGSHLTARRLGCEVDAG